MNEVDHSLPENPTAAEIKQAIKEYIDLKWTTISAALEEKAVEAAAAIDAKIVEATSTCVRVGDAVALKASNGQLVCAQDGGPEIPGEVFEFQSREAIGPHEQFVILK